MPPEAYRATKGEPDAANPSAKAGPVPFFAAGISYRKLDRDHERIERCRLSSNSILNVESRLGFLSTSISLDFGRRR
ncbi:hypothetical protein ACMD2_22458 [Ananas comosus]|uniref:Uncharacterized protein n=1 Tax=Ananas comosus TaxID=4615 RepID=A0A199W7I2_ANACO|nr:hypothetical protein ACMD2_22458 [Ananas comosus]